MKECRIVVTVQNEDDLELVGELVKRVVLSSQYPARVASPRSHFEQALQKLYDLGYWYNPLSQTYVKWDYLD